MEAYHEIMRTTFHPAEEGDVEPLKAKYAELATRSKAWASMPLPEQYKGKGLEKVMEELEKESAAIGEVVRNGSDEEMTESIIALHEVFHKIKGLCDH